MDLECLLLRKKKSDSKGFILYNSIYMTLWKKKNERDGEQMSDPGSGLRKRGWQKKRVGGFHYSDGTVQYLDRDGCHMTLHLPKLIRLQIKNERILLDVNFKIMFFFCSLLLHACYTEHYDILILSWPSKVSIANASSEWEKKATPTILQWLGWGVWPQKTWEWGEDQQTKQNLFKS